MSKVSKVLRAFVCGSSIALAIAGYVYVQPARLDAKGFQGPALRPESAHSGTSSASDVSGF